VDVTLLHSDQSQADASLAGVGMLLIAMGFEPDGILAKDTRMGTRRTLEPPRLQADDFTEE
jgi:hypothetical protein